ncbi:hypothetical protein GUITHDRAFT_99684 [Guillardia theta CCMP2712]|uniref:Transmembrane protein n=1 Tax=Guillardia theta (strain CCMP2712) TaxID=905079 RepID=L1K355_GUITC|nr:hypothetical protein GUITHDRAFT_99684 [Guillardia theta CCMP2712]EKX55044.1 hypothetical protein GUITHDRAFT_99684 [Guillardia theta CCMP2712]|eukprot:XP_005842024.1 hypothetical protein GUITHDRAFT_99684 [Guillardia theta CCMP2712]
MENGAVMETPETSQVVDSPLSPSSQVYTDFLKLHREKKSSVNSEVRGSPNKAMPATQNYHEFIESHLQSKALLKSPVAPGATEATLDHNDVMNGKDDDVSDVTVSTQVDPINLANGTEEAENGNAESLEQPAEDLLELEKKNRELFSALDEHMSKEVKTENGDVQGVENGLMQLPEHNKANHVGQDNEEQGGDTDLNHNDQAAQEDPTPNDEEKASDLPQNTLEVNGIEQPESVKEEEAKRTPGFGGPRQRQVEKESIFETGIDNCNAVENHDTNGSNTIQGEIEVINAKEEAFNQIQNLDIAESQERDTVDLEKMSEEERKEFASKLKDDVATLETCIDEITKNSENDESKPPQLVPPSDEKEPSQRGSGSSNQSSSLRNAIKRIEQALDNIRYVSLGYILVGVTVIGLGIFSMLGIPAWSAGLFLLLIGLINLRRKSASYMLVAPRGFRYASVFAVLLLLASAGVFLFSTIVISSLDGTPTCPGDTINTVCLLSPSEAAPANLDCDKNMTLADYEMKESLCTAVFLCGNHTMLFAPCHTKATINMSGFILCVIMAFCIFFISGWIQVVLERSVSDCNRVRNGGRSIHFADLSFTAYLQHALCCAKTPEEPETTEV